MPYKDPEIQRRYQRERLARIKAEWLLAHGPCVECGSWDDLQVDHVVPSLKVSHNVWSWAPARRDEELEKCQVLCLPCHLKKTAAERKRPIRHGTPFGYHEGCHCARCTEAHRIDKQAWRDARKEAGLPYS